MTQTTNWSATWHGQTKQWWRVAGLALLGLIALIAAIFAISRRETTTPGVRPEDPGVTHVHGLGINPANGDLYAATHMGVFHISSRGKGTRIADRFQDTMGFTVVGSDHFIASGHPDLSDELPPLLGLIESNDAAKTWKALSLRGEADFHVLRYSHDQIYGYDSTGGRLMVSDDGRKWSERSATRVADFVVSPSNENVLLSTTDRGVQQSTDGGRSWSGLGAPPRALLLAWPSQAKLWLIDQSGSVFSSTDNGRGWKEQGTLGAAPEAFIATADGLYAATQRGILRSVDDGRNWTMFFSNDQSGS